MQFTHSNIGGKIDLDSRKRCEDFAAVFISGSFDRFATCQLWPNWRPPDERDYTRLHVTIAATPNGR